MILKSYFVKTNQADPWANINWENHFLTPSLCYAHRVSDYTLETYDYGVHFHDYYELDIIVTGEIRFICDKKSYLPKHLGILFFPPHTLHASMLNAPAIHYERYKIYFHPDALDEYNCRPLINTLLQAFSGGFSYSLKKQQHEQIVALLDRLDESLGLGEDETERIMSVTYVIQLFWLLSQGIDVNETADTYLPEALTKIQEYIDVHFREIHDVREIAQRFFYSREYVSRLFRKYLNIGIAEYVLKCKISESQRLLRGTDLPISEICFSSGFGSLSNFSRAFHEEVKLSPSAYRALSRATKSGIQL